MGARLTFQYDREGDILYVNTREPYPDQESHELGDDVVARLNPTTGEVETLEILFFSTRLLRANVFDIPLDVDLKLAGGKGGR